MIPRTVIPITSVSMIKQPARLHISVRYSPWFIGMCIQKQMLELTSSYNLLSAF